jgi:hypothetical protein
VALPWDMVTAVLVQLEGHGQHPDRDVRRPAPDGIPALLVDPCTTAPGAAQEELAVDSLYRLGNQALPPVKRAQTQAEASQGPT